jgi:alkylated DNA repair dioxygenase AlkB
MEAHVVFGHAFFAGELPAELRRSARAQFEELWRLHPHEPPLQKQPFTGKMIPIPRWQQAYRQRYEFSGTVAEAVELPPILEPYYAWARQVIDNRLNGVVLNWYDARLGHYIGHHRDYRQRLIEGTPIVTISLGASRIFRLRPFKGSGFRNFVAQHGSVFIIPWQTNLNVYHEVPRLASDQGRRISVTVRAFKT